MFPVYAACISHCPLLIKSATIKSTVAIPSVGVAVPSVMTSFPWVAFSVMVPTDGSAKRDDETDTTTGIMVVEQVIDEGIVEVMIVVVLP
jgi:hypothetical protein